MYYLVLKPVGRIQLLCYVVVEHLYRVRNVALAAKKDLSHYSLADRPDYLVPANRLRRAFFCHQCAPEEDFAEKYDYQTTGQICQAESGKNWGA
jgi:hypothetical protein